MSDLAERMAEARAKQFATWTALQAEVALLQPKQAALNAEIDAATVDRIRSEEFELCVFTQAADQYPVDFIENELLAFVGLGQSDLEALRSEEARAVDLFKARLGIVTARVRERNVGNHPAVVHARKKRQEARERVDALIRRMKEIQAPLYALQQAHEVARADVANLKRLVAAHEPHERFRRGSTTLRSIIERQEVFAAFLETYQLARARQNESAPAQEDQS